ncbi:u3 small nucleolar RNA-associated protein 6 domain-containing protein [Ditylenchus destructor]|nr:u3 small nucleolar RNA-associated protein 6 domain-containing protein [Ditylenchus destructor]
MAEFVEINLEKLLPVFENIQAIELLPADELNDIITEFRQHEYRIAKPRKTPEDFQTYATFISNTLERIASQRKHLKMFDDKYHKIDLPLKYKCAFTYRCCSERYKKLEYFRQEIEYARSAKILGVCSQAYTRLLQMHSYDPRLHEEAARFEFFENKSADNSRTIFQMALRKFPKDVDLWVALFDMEINYVKYLLERKKKLTGEGKDQKKGRKRKREAPEMIEAPNDDVLMMKLAEIVCTQALTTVPEEKRSELVRKFCETAKTSCVTLAEGLEKTLIDAKEKYGEDNCALSESHMTEKAEEVQNNDQGIEFWMELIDGALDAGSMGKVEKIFQKAFVRAPALVAAELKAIRLNILSEANPGDPQIYRDAYKKMSSMLPTSISLHFKLIELEEKQTTLNRKFIESAFEKAIVEFGQKSVDCWIKYLQFLLKTSPERVGSVNARAQVNLSPELLDDFNDEWIKLSMS